MYSWWLEWRVWSVSYTHLQGISGIIIDYTEGFKSSQLEPKFKEFLGDKLKHFIVARDKFPIDIFAKGKKELDDNVYIDEDSLDVAERFKSVIGSVYKDLGAQQLNLSLIHI